MKSISPQGSHDRATHPMLRGTLVVLDFCRQTVWRPPEGRASLIAPIALRNANKFKNVVARLSQACRHPLHAGKFTQVALFCVPHSPPGENHVEFWKTS